MAKDQFLAVLSHELRTPLNPILLAVSSMLEGRPTPRRRPPDPGDDPPERQAPGPADRRPAGRDAHRPGQDAAALGRLRLPRADRRAIEICRSEVHGKGHRLVLDLSAEESPRQRRLGQAPSGALEPRQERRQVHARGRDDHDPHPQRGRPRAGRSSSRSPTPASASSRRSSRRSGTRSSRGRRRSLVDSAGWGWGWRSARASSMPTAGRWTCRARAGPGDDVPGRAEDDARAGDETDRPRDGEASIALAHRSSD